MNAPVHDAPRHDAPSHLESRFAPESVGPPLDLIAYGQALLRRRWTILTTVAVALAIGGAVTLLTRPLYTAQATLQIDREAEKVVSRDEATPPDNLGEEFYQTQYGLLRSRALAERVAQSLGLLASDDFIATMKGESPSQAARSAAAGHGRADTTIALLRRSQAVLPERGSRLVTLAVRTPDPRLSARIADAYAENFIESGLDRRFEATSYARDFLEKQLAQVKTRLEDSERALVAYAAAEHIVEMAGAAEPGRAEPSQSVPAANLRAYAAAVATARTERIKAEQRWAQARDANGLGLAEILQSPTIQHLSEERAKLAAEYQDKLSVFKPDYPEMRQLSAGLAEINRQISTESAAVKASLRGQYRSAKDAEAALEGQVASQQGAVLDLRGRSIRYTILQREVDTNRSLYDGLLQRYKEVGVTGGVVANNVSIVDRAVAPTRPSRPRPLFNMLLAALAGLGLGVILAFLLDAVDQAIRSPADVATGLGTPLLGTVPPLPRGASPQDALDDPRSPLSEAYQSLRSSLQFSTSHGLPKTVLITSPSPGGGKSTTAFALARLVARLGFRVLLVDADLRNPSLDRVVLATSQVGLSNLLTGASGLSETVQVTRFPNLSFLGSGPLPPNPAELLAEARLAKLIAEATAAHDMIILDGPPIMALADAPVIGAKVEGAVLVIEANRTTVPQARAAEARLESAGGNVLGVVLTRYKAAREQDGYGYGFDYDRALAGTKASGGKKTARRPGRAKVF